MAYNAAHIRTAIIELLEGTIGSVRTVTAGQFTADVFEAQDDIAKQGLSLADRTQHFDVQIAPLRSNDATPIAANGSFRLSNLLVTIPVWRHANAENRRTQRFADLAEFENALDTAQQALAFTDNLATTSSAQSTGIVNGLLIGPDGTGSPEISPIEESYADELLRAEIVGIAIVNISQATS